MVKLAAANEMFQAMKQQKPKGPLWKGPESNDPLGGITYSMLSRFLACRKRFELYAIQGIRPENDWNHKIQYGNMWHVCEEALAANHSWVSHLTTYALGLRKEYPSRGFEIAHWHWVCETQFPIYMDFWSKHQDVKTRKPLLQEAVFDVPYQLRSGRKVRLRGKWDAVDLIGRGKQSGIYIQENKTKGSVDEAQLKRQMGYNLQSMLYLVALEQYQKIEGNGIISLKWSDGNTPISGVRFNVIRRPLSGGKGTIVRKKGTKGSWNAKKGVWKTPPQPEETPMDYYKRLGSIIKESPKEFFFRWKVDVLPADIQEFRNNCLDPILETLCVYYDWVALGKKSDLPGYALSWRHPHGVYNVIDEGGDADVDSYLETGSMTGLRYTDTLFNELAIDG